MKRAYQPQIPLLKMSLWAFLFGMLVEWNGLNNIILNRNLKVNWLLVPAILLAIISFIPRIYWVAWFGANIPFFIEMFLLAETQILLTALSGILLVRSFNGKQN
ncbi:hypothetical protein [Salirhabdus salicampi]|uniref:hypothetical protein n=1 Tax=Salirhabdus salicampi TaxID=476102 RepID=UPI0020C358AC|nr:hypothetical protein [Salirhabdus salicampi]MCP8616052.1 hypothetical protein [Salirhabdus salicampi]